MSILREIYLWPCCKLLTNPCSLFRDNLPLPASPDINREVSHLVVDRFATPCASYHPAARDNGGVAVDTDPLISTLKGTNSQRSRSCEGHVA